MKKLRRALIFGLVGLVVVVGAALLWIDRLAKIGVETGATYALGVSTTLKSMSVGVFPGEASMRNLRVANPPGFDTPHFLALGDGSVAVSLGSLMSDKVVVPQLTLKDMSVNLESKRGKSNYKEILEGLKKFESDSPKSAEANAGGKKFVIKHVALTDVNVQVDLLPVGGQLSRLPLKIDRIELDNVGSDSASGVDIAELTGILLKAVLTSVADKGGSLLPKEITGELATGLGALKGLGGASVKIVGDVTTIVDGQVRNVAEVGKAMLGGIGEGGKKIGEGLGSVGKGLGNLLNKPKEKKKP